MDSIITGTGKQYVTRQGTKGMIMKYRKKTVVEAILLEPTEKSIREMLRFRDVQLVTNCDTAIDAFESYYKHCISAGFLEIDTLEGTMRANFGDYIIKGVQGEVYPCKPDIFKQTYEAL